MSVKRRRFTSQLKAGIRRKTLAHLQHALASLKTSALTVASADDCRAGFISGVHNVKLAGLMRSINDQ